LRLPTQFDAPRWLPTEGELERVNVLRVEADRDSTTGTCLDSRGGLATLIGRGTKEGQQSAASELEMPMWVWIVIGVGSFLGLSLLVGFALAAILGTIGREISELHETDDWAMLSPTRASKEVKDQKPQEQAKSPRVDRLTSHH
jgi:hypothetical protein